MRSRSEFNAASDTKYNSRSYRYKKRGDGPHVFEVVTTEPEFASLKVTAESHAEAQYQVLQMIKPTRRLLVGTKSTADNSISSQQFLKEKRWERPPWGGYS